jgi:hypothetical protein
MKSKHEDGMPRESLFSVYPDNRWWVKRACLEYGKTIHEESFNHCEIRWSAMLHGDHLWCLEHLMWHYHHKLISVAWYIETELICLARDD